MVTFGSFLGVERQSNNKGSARYRLASRAELNNSWSIAHGGVLMTLLDIALGSAAYTMVDAQTEGVLTIDLQTQFLSPGIGVLIGEGRVVKAGKVIIFCEGEITNESGEIIAKATGTFKVRRRKRKVDIEHAEKTGW
jgi:uncharacterized protein (TIGR00369 family)